MIDVSPTTVSALHRPLQLVVHFVVFTWRHTPSSRVMYTFVHYVCLSGPGSVFEVGDGTAGESVLGAQSQRGPAG